MDSLLNKYIKKYTTGAERIKKKLKRGKGKVSRLKTRGIKLRLKV